MIMAGFRQAGFFRCERGVAAIEFAMIVPVFALILIGIADYGMFMNQKMKIQDLSVTAVQYVAQGGSETNVVSGVINTSDFYVASAAKGQTINVTTSASCECANGNSISCNLTCPNTGDYLRHYYTVTLTSAYTPIFPYPGIPNSITLTGSSRMQYNPP